MARLPTLANYLITENPYNLIAPPAWWLQKLADYDAQLVVFPSRCRPAYILARRRSATLKMAEQDRLDKNLLRQSAGMDGDILADNNLVYVRHLLGNTVRRLEFFQWLKDADTWIDGKPGAWANKLENAENEQAARQRALMISDIDHRARDAYRSYKARTGGSTIRTYGQRTHARQMPVARFTE